MKSQKAYLVQLPSEEQLGPLDEEALVKLAESGQLPGTAKVRHTLLDNWSLAYNMDFLKSFYRKELEQKAAEYNQNPAIRRMLDKKKIFGKDVIAVAQQGITLTKPCIFKRFVAALLDVVALAFIAALIFLACWLLQKVNCFPTTAPMCCYLLLTWLVFTSYYVYAICKRGQTWGQSVCNLFPVTKDATPVTPDKAFLFGALFAILGISSPLVYLASGCKFTIHEVLSQTYVRKISIGNGKNS